MQANQHFCNYASPEEAERRAAMMNDLAESERRRIAALPAHVRANHGAGFMNVTLYRYSAGAPVVSADRMGGLYRAALALATLDTKS